MRYFPVIAMFVSASAFTLYLLDLDALDYDVDWGTMLILLSPVFLAGLLVLLLKFSK